MAGIGTPELLVVLVILLLVFGGSKLPQLARSLGTARREFERGQQELTTRSPAPDHPARGHDAA